MRPPALHRETKTQLLQGIIRGIASNAAMVPEVQVSPLIIPLGNGQEGTLLLLMGHSLALEVEHHQRLDVVGQLDLLPGLAATPLDQQPGPAAEGLCAAEPTWSWVWVWGSSGSGMRQR